MPGIAGRRWPLSSSPQIERPAPWSTGGRAVQHLGGLPVFHDPAGIHDGDLVGDLPDHGNAVGDEMRPMFPTLPAAPSSRARICAYTVTWGAVVGSSAMISTGARDSAIAITMRWRMPPESWSR